MTDQRRGKKLALVGLVLQVAFSVTAFLLWGTLTNSDAVWSAMWFVAAGVPLWMMAAILFYCRQLAAREAAEIEEIAAHGGERGALFERAGELENRPAAKRLAWTEKWIAPAFTLLWMALQILIVVLVGRTLLAGTVPVLHSPGEGAVLLLLAAMVSFLFSYYCLGMSRDEQWRLLRAPGSYLLVNALAAAVAAVALLLGYWKGGEYARVDDIVAWVYPALQAVLSVELLLNFVLDLYRPRVPGQEHRFSFDSRLCNLLAEPGKVGHSIAETLNYQFGFEVSKTWFYQLVSRAMVPLLVAGALILLGMSCVVIVRDGETYVVREWGKLPPGAAPLAPGLHLKWPWPVQTAERFQTGAIHEVLLGAGEPRSLEEQATDYIGKLQVADWSREHGPYTELDFLIAVPPADQSSGQKKSPVHVIKLVVLVQYLVRDVREYGYQYVEPQKMLECLAYRELTRYFATATLDSPVPGGGKDRPEAIMTYGRARAEAELKKRVQEQADDNHLGVQITYVGFLGVHPPADAYKDFEKVLQSQRGMEQARYKAEADAAGILTRYAGSPSAALQLALAIQMYEELKDLDSLRSNAAGFAAQRRKYLTYIEERIEEIRKEVSQERLEGKQREGRPTDRQELLASYERYAALLGRVKAPSDLTARHVEEAQAAADRLFAQASGEPAALVASAQASRWKLELTQRGTWEAFQSRLKAYEASPQVYMWDHWLGVWEESLPSAFKYVMGVDREKVELWLDFKREPSVMETNIYPDKKPEEKK